MPTRPLTELMTRDPICATPQTPVPEVARMLRDEDTGIIPVVDSPENRRLVGVVTDRDLVVRLVAQDVDVTGAMAHQAMSEQVATLGEDATLEDCVRLMAEKQVRRVPIVTGDGMLVGIVSQADLARAAEDDKEIEDEVAGMVEQVSEPG